jgi:ATP-dependent helicase HepA
LFRDRLDTIDDALITETREAVTRLEAAQRSGRNRLLTWKHELEEADGAEMEALQESDEDPELLPFAETLWTAFGLELEYLQAADYLLKPGPFDDGTLTVRSEGLRLTPDRRRALEREDMDLLTWDHPLIREGMDAGARSVTGTCNCVTAKDITQPLLQLLYTVEAVAPGALEVDRFLPPTPFLLTLDVRGNVYKEPVILTGEGQAGEWLSNAAVRSEWLPSRLEDGERKARGFCRVVCERAAAEADQVLRAEWKRLESLRAGNDHVRLSEIAYAKEQHRAVLEAIGEVRPRLEALRLIVGQSAI